MEVTREQEISQIQMNKPHLVILGAGASYAAFPNGDRNNKKLPLMSNLIGIIGLEDLIKSSGLKFTTNNFEEIYSQLCDDDNYNELRIELENKIYNYFSKMELPDTPTIYDYLILSMRKKDYIATFNWDPFLVQAYYRNRAIGELPNLIFLHGNVSVSTCQNGHSYANIRHVVCNRCGELIYPSKLMFPVTQKDYHLDPYISKQWEILRSVMENVFMITIFGYGAPVSDISAIDLMKSAWGSIDKRNMEEIEIIDVREENDLRKTWDKFIHTHHYQIHTKFHDSWIGNHPRRTGEAYINQFIEAKFIENNPIPQNIDLNELHKWINRLVNVEINNKK